VLVILKKCAGGFSCSKRTTVRAFILYEENNKDFFGKNVVYPVTSLNCSVHCTAVSVNFPIVLHDGEY